MKIAIVCDVLGKENNGTSIAAMNLIRHMQEAGHEVRVICCDADKAEQEGYYVVPVCNLGSFLNKILENNGVSVAKCDEETLLTALDGVDVVQVEIPLSLGMAAARIAREKGIPLSASFHCQAENITSHLGLMNFHLANHIIYKYFYQHLYRYCATVHYPTEFIRDLFESEVKEKTNAYVISNGVNRAFFEGEWPEVRNEKFTIVCSGRYSAEKAQHILLKAVEQSRHRDGIRVVLAGDGPRKKELTSLAEQCGVDAELTFFSRPDLIRLLRSADLYVHTATAEIEALSCTEAIVSGLVPVISNSKESATRAFALDERNLFEKNNYRDLAEKIDFWFEHPDLKREYREKYRAMIANFDQDECMRKMEAMLCTAAASK